MSAQHTPGPWSVDEPHQVLAESVGEYVAITQAEEWNALPRDQVEANARLIAAAPELLFELKKCASLLKTAFGETNDLTGKAVIAQRLESVTALIAKATGAA